MAMKDCVPNSRFVELMEKKKKGRKSKPTDEGDEDDTSADVLFKAENYIYNDSISIEENVELFTRSLVIK